MLPGEFPFLIVLISFIKRVLKNIFKKSDFLIPISPLCRAKCQGLAWLTLTYPHSLTFHDTDINSGYGATGPSLHTSRLCAFAHVVSCGTAFPLYSQGFVFITPLFQKNFNVALFVPAEFLFVFKDLFNDSSQVFPLASQSLWASVAFCVAFYFVV